MATPKRSINSFSLNRGSEKVTATKYGELRVNGLCDLSRLSFSVVHAIEASASMAFPTATKHARHVTGRVMAELIGRIDGGRLRSLVEERCAGSGVPS